MRHLKLKAGLIAIYGILALTAMIPVGTLYWARLLQGSIDRSERRTFEMVNLLSLMKDVETGQRGFIITGAENFLEPYQSGLESLGPAREELRSEMAATVHDRTTMSDLDRLIEAKLYELSRTIALRREQGFIAVAPIISNGVGKAYLDQIRAIIDTERRSGEQRKSALLAEVQRRQTINAYVGGAAALLGLALLAALLLRLLQVSSAQREAELKAEKNFYFLAESVPQMVWTAKPDGHADYYNDRWFTFTGMTKAQAQGGDWAPVHPEDLASSRRAWAECVETGSPYHVEQRFKRAEDGTYRWHLCQALPLRDAQARIVKWFGTCTDIHDYKEEEAKNRAWQAELEARVKERTAQLERSHETLALALGAGDMGVWEWRSNPSALRMDEQMYRLYGRSQESAEDPLTIWKKSLHPEDRARCEQEFSHAVRYGSRLDSEFRIVIPSGELRHVKTRGQVLRDAGDVSQRMVGVNFDITSRKLAEQILHATQERLVLATGAAGIGVWEWDLIKGTVQWDQHMYRLYGLDHPTSEASYATWTACLHPEDLARTEQELKRAVHDGVPFDTEFRIVTPRGAVRYIRAVAQLQRDASGEPRRVVGVNFDITERKQAELELQHTSSLLQNVLDSAEDICIIALKLDNTIAVFNKGAERLLGYTSAEVLQTSPILAIHDPGEIEARAAELSTLLGRPVAGIDIFKEPAALNRAYEWTYIRKDQRRVPVSLIVSPMYAKSGELIGYMSIARDITEEREQQSALQHAMRQAERANAAKSQFLANMSHEIRTPLNAVIGLGYLLEQTPLSQEQRSFLTKINFAGRSLLSVINNVLDLSKIEAGEMILEEADFDLQNLAQEVGQMLTPQAQGKGIELRVRSATGLPRRVSGDETRLRQVMTNLLNNAIKFTERGYVELELSAVEERAADFTLRCAVRDTGIGIPTEALSRLFTPFAQADTSTTRRFGGTGLGLSIARKFIELLGGKIGVTSELGVGSEFWIEVPLRTAVSADSSNTSHKRSALQILILQTFADEQSLESIVTPFGWLSHRVDGVEKAITHLRGGQSGSSPDLIFIDAQLPDTDVASFAARLRHEFPHRELPPVVAVLESTIEVEKRQPLLQQGITAFLVHPVTSSALFNLVNSVLAKRAGDHASVLHATQYDQVGVQWLPGARILVVDDSDINREVAQHILEKQGATVATSCNGVDALTRLRETPEAFDIVLMDVQMPVMDGNEATHRIREELGLINLPIIALTAGALVSERERSIAAGMDEFLSKPLEPALLIRTVRRFIEKARGIALQIGIGDGENRTAAVGADLTNIDAAVAQRVFGDDAALFASLLTRVLHDFGEFSLPVSVDLADAATRKELKARVHKLRGSAGSIGAQRIQLLAAAAEGALEENQPADFVEAILRQVAAAFIALGEEVRPILETQAAHSAARLAGMPASPPADVATIGQLLDLLEDQNLDAMTHFHDNESSLRSAFGQLRFTALKEAIDGLDFPEAAIILRESAALDQRGAGKLRFHPNAHKG